VLQQCPGHTPTDTPQAKRTAQQNPPFPAKNHSDLAHQTRHRVPRWPFIQPTRRSPRETIKPPRTIPSSRLRCHAAEHHSSSGIGTEHICTGWALNPRDTRNKHTKASVTPLTYRPGPPPLSSPPPDGRKLEVQRPKRNLRSRESSAPKIGQRTSSGGDSHGLRIQPSPVPGCLPASNRRLARLYLQNTPTKRIPSGTYRTRKKATPKRSREFRLATGSLKH